MIDVIDAEDLNLLIGNIPYDKKGSDQVKLNIKIVELIMTEQFWILIIMKWFFYI